VPRSLWLYVYLSIYVQVGALGAYHRISVFTEFSYRLNDKFKCDGSAPGQL
jgi:hypothetical protein